MGPTVEIPAADPGQSVSPRDATREKLILAAEALFAEFGVEAVALRTVCAAAGQRNMSAVHYHFGDKSTLFEAIFEYREAQLEPMRAALLRQAKAPGRPLDVRALLRVTFEPYVRLLADSGSIAYFKLTSFYINHMRPCGVPHPIDFQNPSTEASRESMALLKARMAFLPPDQVHRRLLSVSGLFLSAFIQNASREPEARSELDALFEDTLEMMAAALGAPPWR